MLCETVEKQSKKHKITDKVIKKGSISSFKTDTEHTTQMHDDFVIVSYAII